MAIKVLVIDDSALMRALLTEIINGAADLHVVGAAPDPELALRRYETAFARLGFTEILYAYEPVAAAFFFAGAAGLTSASAAWAAARRATGTRNGEQLT